MMISRIGPPAAIVLMMVCADIGSLSAESITGLARVIDGDSIVIGSTHIRLAGIDAPESKQDCIYHGKAYHCGRFATARLVRISVRQSVRCESEGRDRYGRTLANCWVGDVSINQSMVATGWAVAYRRYTSLYAGSEDTARLARRGIWSGSFERPEHWRQARR